MTPYPQVVTGFLHARPERADELSDRLLDLVGPARSETGCVEFHVHRSADDTTLLVMYEAWLSAEDLQRHLDQPYMKDFMGSIGDYLVGEPEVYPLQMTSPHPVLEPSAAG